MKGLRAKMLELFKTPTTFYEVWLSMPDVPRLALRSQFQDMEQAGLIERVEKVPSLSLSGPRLVWSFRAVKRVPKAPKQVIPQVDTNGIVSSALKCQEPLAVWAHEIYSNRPCSPRDD